MHELLTTLELFARAGGGGSSGGGGGGGGGGSGGGGNLIGGLIATTMFPSMFFATIIKKRFKRKTAFIITTVSGSITTITVFIVLFMYLNLAGLYFALILAVGIWLGWYSTMFDLWNRLGKKFKKADADLAKAEQADSAWNEEKLHAHVTEVFMRYQKDWQARDWSRVNEYMTQRYAYHNYLMMRALREMRRINVIQEPSILKMDTVEVHDSLDDTQDRFSVVIHAQITDILVDESDMSKPLTIDTSPFYETWNFIRSGNTWLLDAIDQTGTVDMSSSSSSLKQFAEQHNLFYSLDWGKLLLPTDGQLLARNGMGWCDINNHLIGIYDTHLVQLYSFTRIAKSRMENNKNYIVAQLNIPKSYGSIIIKPKTKFFSTEQTFTVPNKTPSGELYQRHDLEWSSFNAKYTVYSTRQDALATFELLNPSFMQFLHDHHPKATIQVVDNIIYIAVPANEQNTDYALMLEILGRAHKELKM